MPSRSDLLLLLLLVNWARTFLTSQSFVFSLGPCVSMLWFALWLSTSSLLVCVLSLASSFASFSDPNSLANLALIFLFDADLICRYLSLVFLPG